jgi:hypothetical protein
VNKKIYILFGVFMLMIFSATKVINTHAFVHIFNQESPIDCEICSDFVLAQNDDEDIDILFTLSTNDFYVLDLKLLQAALSSENTQFFHDPIYLKGHFCRPPPTV